MVRVRDVMVLKEVAEFGFKLVLWPNVVVDRVGSVVDVGAVDGVHGIEVVSSPVDGWEVRGCSIDPARSGELLGTPAGACDNVL